MHAIADLQAAAPTKDGSTKTKASTAKSTDGDTAVTPPTAAAAAATAADATAATAGATAPDAAAAAGATVADPAGQLQPPQDLNPVADEEPAPALRLGFVQRFAIATISHPDFEHVVMLLIACNCVTLAAYNPLLPAHDAWNARLDFMGEWALVLWAGGACSGFELYSVQCIQGYCVYMTLLNHHAGAACLRLWYITTAASGTMSSSPNTVDTLTPHIAKP